MKKYLLTAAIGKHEQRFKEMHDSRFNEYARHWNFEYIPHFAPLDLEPHSNLYWSKMKLILQLLNATNDGDLIVWLDADVCIVQGDIELTTSKDVGITFDVRSSSNPPDLSDDLIFGLNRLNVGVMAVRSNDFTRKFFKNVFDNTRFDYTTWPDQIAFVTEMQSLPNEEISKHFEILPSCLNVTLESRIAPEDVRFRHFAGEFHLGWSQEMIDRPIVFETYVPEKVSTRENTT